MDKQYPSKTTALTAAGISILLLSIWFNYKDFILNEQLVGYQAQAGYPEVQSSDIFRPNQTVEFHFSCEADHPHPSAERWILYLTGTAYAKNTGHMKISIDDSNSKVFRTFAFKDYRYEYIIPFNKHSLTLPKTAQVHFKFEGNNSEPLFEIPMVRLISEESYAVPLPKNTIIPFSHKKYKKSGSCHIEESKILGAAESKG